MNTCKTALFALAALNGAALANPVNGSYSDLPNCDNHGPLVAVEELGTGPLFPSDELISAVSTFVNTTVCPLTDDPSMPNVLVEIRNLSGRAWTDLYYVADPGTTFSNYDGIGVSATVPGVSGLAVRLDEMGGNKPLVFESMVGDGIFAVGETWRFVLQDWSDAAGLSADMMGSLDFAGASFGDFDSTGSIVQFLQVPAPSAAMLFGIGSLTVVRRRR